MDSPNTSKRRDIQIDAVYDLECANWTDFVCGGYLESDGTYQLYSEHRSAGPVNDQTRMADMMLARGGTVWAHGGGFYDHKWLIDIAARRNYTADISSAGPRIVTARIGKLNLRDTYALIPATLKELTAGQGIHKEELDLPCICENKCAGYCSIKRDMPVARYRRLTEYLRADCESLMQAMQKVRAYAADNDLDMTATVGSSSWRTMQRWLGLPPADLDANEHTFARGGYYGGRCQIPWPGEHRDVYRYDVSSMYPWSMKELAMPIGQHTRVYGADARAAFGREAPGLYQCTIDVPDMHLPPLPYRTKNRISYPTGRLTGTWCLPEIQYALSIGCKLRDVGEAIYWHRKAEKLFAPYVDKHFDLRAAVGKKSPVGIWLKFRLNSPTGKLGANPEKEHFFVNPSVIKKCPSSERCKYDGQWDCARCCEYHCTQRCGAMAEHSDYIWSQYRYHLDDCAHVEWASYLTAGARIEWHRQAVSVADGWDVLYGDTDSLRTLQPRTRRIGLTLGLWNDEGRIKRFVGHAPKTYWEEHYTDDSGACPLCKSRLESGTVCSHIDAKAKGLGAPRDKPLELGKVYPRKGVIGLKHGAKLGTLFTAKDGGRKARFGTGDRVLLDNGRTRAPTVTEVSEWE